MVLYLIAVGCERILVVAFAEVGAAQVSMGSTFTCNANPFFPLDPGLFVALFR